MYRNQPRSNKAIIREVSLLPAGHRIPCPESMADYYRGTSLGKKKIVRKFRKTSGNKSIAFLIPPLSGGY